MVGVTGGSLPADIWKAHMYQLLTGREIQKQLRKKKDYRKWHKEKKRDHKKWHAMRKKKKDKGDNEKRGRR